MGVVVPDAWMTWFKGAVVPALLGLLTVPLAVFWLAPPDMTHSPEAPILAAARLRDMGPPSRNELVTLGVLMVGGERGQGEGLREQGGMLMVG